MHKMKALFFLLAGFLTLPAFGAEVGDAEIVYSQSDVAFTFDSVFNSSGTFPELNYDHSVQQIGYSMRTNEWFAFDVRIGKGDTQTIVLTGATSGTFPNDIGRVLGAYGRAHWPINDYIEPYFLLGFTQFDGDIKETSHSTGYGLNFRFGDFGFRVERNKMLSTVRTSAEADVLSISYYF